MVAWKKLGEVCGLERGVRVIKKDLQQEGIIPVYQNSLAPLGFFDKSNYPSNTPFVICAGAAGEVGFCNKPFWAADDCTCILCSPSIDNKYIYYCLLVNQHSLKSQVRKASVPRLSKDVISKLIIPIPSLSEQQQIVEQLDTFTSSIENLKEQIAQRRKQYEYYRDQLLDLEGKEGVEMKTLSEICEIKGRIGFRGYTREDQVGKGEGALSLAATNIANQRIDYSNNTYITWEKYYESPEIMVKNGDIIVCQRGSIGKIAYVENLPEKATINPQLLLIKNIKINNKYLIHVLLSRYFQDELSQIIGHGTVQMIAQKDFKNLLVPVPSISEQQRIVSILDTFEASVANLEHQLAQREKQYEYYRNKLLTFE